MAEISTTHPQAEPEYPIEQQDARRFPVLWERIMLAGILLLAALMDFYKLGQNGFDTYYSPAVRSMMDNWHNFFFAAYDPGGFTAIDKPPVGFWLQVLSAKIFGLNPVSVLVPQALCGVLSVFVLYYLVRRHFGVVAGLIAALALAISPISVVTNRNDAIDSTLALCLLLGAWVVLRAAETGKLRWLLLTAVIVGIGFNIKMLEAYLVVPAFGLLYLLAAPTSIRKRVLHLALALLVLLVVSFSWMTVVDLTPASQRPHVGTTQDDSELSLALGYNGLQRLLAGTGLGGTGSGNANPAPAGSTGGPTNQPGKQPAGRLTQILNAPVPGPLRLFTVEPLAGQESWLLPLALLSIVALAWRGRPRPREDRRVHALILWGMWLLTMGIFFSVAGFFHEYYLTVMTPAVAALCGIGLVVMWRDYRAGGWRGWLLPASLLLTAAEQIVILTNYPTWGQWMIPLLTVPCLLVAGMLIGARIVARRAGGAKAVRAGALLSVLTVALIALALAPTVWAAIPILQGTEAYLPLAGPAQVGGPGAVASTGGQVTADPALVQYLEEHQGHAHVLVVTDATNTDGLILATNKPLMPLSGFSSYPLTASEAASLVASGTVRFFLLNGGGGAPGSRINSVTSWVAQHCATVPPSLWQSSPSSAQTGGGVGEQGEGAAVLYDCATPRR